MKRVLFVLKKNGYGLSSGLLNSAEKNAQSLMDMGYESKVVVVPDNNSIDREVSQYKPTHVIIEAIWVVPEKMRVLTQLHPRVTWVILIHSKAPFLANEGIAMRWIWDYIYVSREVDNLRIACNNLEFFKDFRDVTHTIGITRFLPNMYSYDVKKKSGGQFSGVVNVGCFGSLRPMKNHLEQAIAAMLFANSVGKQLHFHINASRMEQRGENVLKNLKGLFSGTRHKLVEHNWMPHEQFLEIINGMDMGMQVSLSESFNIVTADFVLAGVPIVVSEDISWMPRFTKCCPTDTDKIVSRLKLAYSFPLLFRVFSRVSLARYNRMAKKQWRMFLR
jgi:hypothetical protein